MLPGPQIFQSVLVVGRTGCQFYVLESVHLLSPQALASIEQPRIQDYLQVFTGIGMKGETRNDVNATELTIALPNLWVPSSQREIQNFQTEILKLLLQHTVKVKDLTKDSK